MQPLSLSVFFFEQTAQASICQTFLRRTFVMSLETILIIAVIVFLLGGGGWYWQRGRG